MGTGVFDRTPVYRSLETDDKEAFASRVQLPANLKPPHMEPWIHPGMVPPAKFAFFVT